MRQIDWTNLNLTHNEGIKRAADELKAKGYTVYADHIEGYGRPALISRKRPDICYIKNGKKYLIEVETSNSFDTPHSSAQARAFVQSYPLTVIWV